MRYIPCNSSLADTEGWRGPRQPRGLWPKLMETVHECHQGVPVGRVPPPPACQASRLRASFSTQLSSELECHTSAFEQQDRNWVWIWTCQVVSDMWSLVVQPLQVSKPQCGVLGRGWPELSSVLTEPLWWLCETSQEAAAVTQCWFRSQGCGLSAGRGQGSWHSQGTCDLWREGQVLTF